MKKIIVFTLTALLLMATAALAAEGFPLTLAGQTLGQYANKFACGDTTSATPMPDAPFLSETRIKPDCIPGVRGGSLTFANCKDIGKIVGIKLKFNDRSQTLFNKLLDKYKDTYGKPDSYQGDAFRNVIAWQWDFTKNGERVELMLMWSRDKEMRPGVSIKMTLRSMIDSEYSCYSDKAEKLKASKGASSKIKSVNDFVPK